MAQEMKLTSAQSFWEQSAAYAAAGSEQHGGHSFISLKICLLNYSWKRELALTLSSEEACVSSQADSKDTLLNKAKNHGLDMSRRLTACRSVTYIYIRSSEEREKAMQ